jgi:hypothetical protein
MGHLKRIIPGEATTRWGDPIFENKKNGLAKNDLTRSFLFY